MQYQLHDWENPTMPSKWVHTMYVRVLTIRPYVRKSYLASVVVVLKVSDVIERHDRKSNFKCQNISRHRKTRNRWLREYDACNTYARVCVTSQDFADITCGPNGSHITSYWDVRLVQKYERTNAILNNVHGTDNVHSTTTDRTTKWQQSSYDAHVLNY